MNILSYWEIKYGFPSNYNYFQLQFRSNLIHPKKGSFITLDVSICGRVPEEVL